MISKRNHPIFLEKLGKHFSISDRDFCWIWGHHLHPHFTFESMLGGYTVALPENCWCFLWRSVAKNIFKAFHLSIEPFQKFHQKLDGQLGGLWNMIIWPQERIQKHHPNGVRPTKIPRLQIPPQKGRCQQIVTAVFSAHFRGFRSWVLLRGRFFSGYLNGTIPFHTFSSVFFLFWPWFWIFWGVFVRLLFLFVWISKKEREVCFGGTNNYLATKWLVTCEICHWDVTLGSRIKSIFWLPWQVKCCQEGKPLPLRLVSGWSGVFNPVCWLLLVPITETFVGVSGPRCRRCCFLKYFRSPTPSLRLRTCSDAVKKHVLDGCNFTTKHLN